MTSGFEWPHSGHVMTDSRMGLGVISATWRKPLSSHTGTGAMSGVETAAG